VDRRLFIASLIGGAFAAPLAVEAQQPKKVPRIGVLSPFFPCPGSDPAFEAFAQGLRERGRVEGQNIAIEFRWAEGKLERLSDLVAELVRLKVDVVVASSTAPALAAKNATASTPIVMLYVADPVGRGLVASLARPGGNITGLSWGGIELSSKQLELAHDSAVRAHPGGSGHRVGPKPCVRIVPEPSDTSEYQRS